MAWWIALRAEILRGFDNARTEMHLPVAVHGHARRERMPGINQPFRQAQTVCRKIFRERGQDGGHTGSDYLTAIAVIAAAQNGGLAGLLHFLHHHGCWDHPCQFFLLMAQLFKLGI